MRIELREGDMACLSRLINGPLEIGVIPEATIKRLTSRGLVKRVLGSCEITGAGQLSYHRQYFPKAPRISVVSASPNDPLYQKEASRRDFRRDSRLSRVRSMRRKIDAHIRQASEFPHWLMRMAAQTAGQFRSIQKNNAIAEDGRTQNDKGTD
jgi:hypothetical protein